MNSSFLFNWKEFFKPTFWKITTSIILLILFGALGFVCQPTYLDFNGTSLACGQIGMVFFIPVLFGFKYPVLWLFYFALFYLLICILFNNKKRKK